MIARYPVLGPEGPVSVTEGFVGLERAVDETGVRIIHGQRFAHCSETVSLAMAGKIAAELLRCGGLDALEEFRASMRSELQIQVIE